MSPIALPRPIPDPDTGIPNTLDDLAALRRYATTGDPRAFELVTARYEAMVLATCRRVLRNPADAEDAAQQAFLKLAAHAGRIRSNAAAWLHACAMRTATDVARAAGARRTHEGKAAEASADASSDEFTAPEWRELEHQLDQALAKLDDADRDLVVARFLAGRSQAGLAREAGVNPGTLHRRLNKALERLRAHLYESGVSMTAVALAGGLAALHAASPAPSAALHQTLAKVALAAMPKPAALTAGLSARTIATAAVTLTLTAGIIAGGATILRSNAATTGATGATAVTAAPRAVPANAAAPDRPTETTDPLAILGASAPVYMGGTFTFDGAFMRFTIPDTDRAGRTVTSELTLRVGAVDTDADPVTINAVVTRSNVPEDADYNIPVGTPLKITAAFDRLGRVELQTRVNTPRGVVNQTWSGTRPAPGTLLARDIPEDAGPTGLLGPWFQTNDWSLTLGERDIAVKTGEINGRAYTIHRFRIIDWDTAADEQRGPHARVQALAADSMDPRLVGKRVKLILRERGDTIDIAYHDHGSPLLNEWPRTFEPTAGEPIQIICFSRARP